MKIDDIKRFELEITSNCNAACPGCLRTKEPDNYDILSLTFDDIKRIFPSSHYIKDREFLLCGALGDPVLNKDCFSIIQYIIDNGGSCVINSNASLETATWWNNLGKLSAATNRISMWFCVDGYRETNHLYRVNTNFDKIIENMEAYVAGGAGRANASWVYIVFDHNEHEVELAREHAAKLGISFATRTGVANSLGGWQSVTKKKDKKTKEVDKKVTWVQATSKVHSKMDKVIELRNFIYNKTGVDDTELKEKIVTSIKCKFYHEGEMFVASNQTLWPCCFLWSDSVKHPIKAKLKFANFEENWNSLLHHSIDEILQNPWFEVILRESWDTSHEMHLSRCIENCAYNQAHQNEITYDTK